MSQSLRFSLKMVEGGTKELAYSLCRTYLGGEWAKVSFSNFQIERIALSEKHYSLIGSAVMQCSNGLSLPARNRGGLTNYLFLCSLPSEIKNNTSPFSKVLLRLYGIFYNEMSENRFRMLEECLVCGLLAEKKMGPDLYGIFPEGRLEQYIPNVRSLSNIDVQDPLKSKQIGQNVASFHKLTLPLSKDPTWHLKSIQKFSQSIKGITFSDPSKSQKLEQLLKKFDLESELKFLRMLVENSKSPVVFCHNDVQPGNLLVKTSSTPENAEVHLIDFEYSCYNYRGYDIGNHFCEWMHDYSYQEYPFFKGTLDYYPSHVQKKNRSSSLFLDCNRYLDVSKTHFVRSYLQSFDEKNMSDEEVEKIIVEADRLSLVSHFYWALWSIIQESKSKINFGFLDYALWRLKCYEHFKYFADEDDHRNLGLRNRIIGLKL